MGGVDMTAVRLDVLLDAAALQRLAEETRLPITAPDAWLPGIAAKIATALVRYAIAKELETRQPKLKDTATRARKLAEAARGVLALLDAAGGPVGSIGLLNADPARGVPGLPAVVALDTAEARGDAARNEMLAEEGVRLDMPSPFSAEDVARVAAAALRQLVVLAEAAAERNAMVLPIGNQDPAAPPLFAVLRDAFEELHSGFRYTVTNTARGAGKRDTVPSGPALAWTLALLRHVAEQAIDTPHAGALRALADRYAAKRDGLAARIREAGEPRKRRHFYRVATAKVESS